MIKNESKEIDLQTLAQHIAINLPAGWSYVAPPIGDFGQSNSSCYIEHKDGAKLWLCLDNRSNGLKIEVKGQYCKLNGNILPYSSDDRPNSINVSATRSPDVIARDIAKRYLPEYMEAYQKGKESLERYENFQKDKESLANRMREILKQDQPSEENTDKQKTSFYGQPGMLIGDRYSCSVDGEAEDGKTVKLILSGVPADVAEKILKLLMKGGE